jgi:hypothetical protein
MSNLLGDKLQNEIRNGKDLMKEKPIKRIKSRTRRSRQEEPLYLQV